MSIFVSIVCAVTLGQVAGNSASLEPMSAVGPLEAKKESQASGTIVLGKLGQAKLPCQIFAKPDIGSAVHYSVKAHEYIVVNTAKEPGWAKVLLNNGIHGYVQSDSINVTEFQVTTIKRIQSAKLGKVHGLAKAADLALLKCGPVSDAGLSSGLFVQRMFAKVGVKMSADPEKQSKVGQTVPTLEKLEKGDRVYFWVEKSGKIDEVGIYLGNGYFVYLNEASGEVETQYLGEKKWLKKLVAARR